MAVGFLAAEVVRPTQRMSLREPVISLAQQVPEKIGTWQIDKSIVPIMPSPDVQAKLDTLYSQTLARTYVNPLGQRVMLSIAYGSDQGSEATQVHRPEFCYSAQGFQVKALGESSISIGAHELPIARLIGTMDTRIEPITYWVTLADTATLPGMNRRLAQLQYGLHGYIPDGMLIRVSTIGMSKEQGFELQTAFVRELFATISPEVRDRYFGTFKENK